MEGRTLEIPGHFDGLLLHPARGDFGLGVLCVNPRLSAVPWGHGLIPGGGTPEALGAFLKSEIAKWAKLIKAIGLRVQ